MKYVSPKYEAQLDQLAEDLVVKRERFAPPVGDLAVQLSFDLPEIERLYQLLPVEQ